MDQWAERWVKLSSGRVGLMLNKSADSLKACLDGASPVLVTKKKLARGRSGKPPAELPALPQPLQRQLYGDREPFSALG